jgi:hypothetical protein
MIDRIGVDFFHARQKIRKMLTILGVEPPADRARARAFAEPPAEAPHQPDSA